MAQEQVVATRGLENAVKQAESELGVRTANKQGEPYKDNRKRIGGVVLHTGETYEEIMEVCAGLPQSIKNIYSPHELYKIAQGVKENGMLSEEELDKGIEKLRAETGAAKYADIAVQARKLVRESLQAKDLERTRKYALIDGLASQIISESALISDVQMNTILALIDCYREDTAERLDELENEVRRLAGYPGKGSSSYSRP
jgi:hypothetical protein